MGATTFDANTSDLLSLAQEVTKSLYNKNTGDKAPHALHRVIVDVQIETQLNAGANLLSISIADPDFSLMTEGMFAMEETEGLSRLPELVCEINGVKWRLVDMQGTSDITQPNVVLEFQNELAALMRRKFGPLKAIRTPHMTRAEFIKSAVESTKGIKVDFICPLLEEVQPIHKESETYTPEEKESLKKKGINRGQNLGLSAEQTKNAQTILEVCDTHKAGHLATLAAMETGLAESNLKNVTQSGGPAQGVFQMEPFLSAAEGVNPFDVAEACTAFLTKYGKYKGAIQAAEKNPNAKAYEIAQMTQNSSTGEASNGKVNYGAQEQKAIDIIAAYGGVTEKTASTDKPYEFAIGSEENYWAGVLNLAQEVEWPLWFEENRLYYMKSTELILAEPLAHIDVVDKKMRTTVEVLPDGKRKRQKHAKEYESVVNQFTFGISETEEKAKAELQTKVKKGSTYSNGNPGAALTTECTVQLVCPPNFIRAGDVCILKDRHNKAPWYVNGWEGRWVATNVTRSVYNIYSEITFAIPGSSSLPMPLDEPEHSASTETEAKSSTKGLGGVVEVAKKALKEQQANPNYYEYDEVRPMPKSLFGNSHPIKIDCSAFATLCYKEAKEPDPNGLGYNGEGFTGTLESHGEVTKNPVPGDLVFWHNQDHVAVYIGEGKIISMGTEGDPSEETVTAETAYHESFVGYRTYHG